VHPTSKWKVLVWIRVAPNEFLLNYALLVGWITFFNTFLVRLSSREDILCNTRMQMLLISLGGEAVLN